MRQIGLIILLFFTSLAYAQNVEFKASAPSVVAVGEQFKLEYTLNKEGDNLKVPTLEGFDLLMGPSVGQSFYSSNINGKMTQNVTFSYTYILEGTKKGTFQIPGATVIIDGKEYTSNALKIEVVEGSRNSNGNQAATNRPVQPDANATVNDNNLFVKVEVSRRSLYMGESLMATIKVYTKVDLVNLGRTKFPDFNGFLAEEVPTPQRIELVREAVDGQIYNVGTIRKVLLYPQHTGEITIEPFELECIVRQRLANGGRSFFDEFFGNYKDVRAMRRSKPVTIQVKELPQLGKPAGFGGTVGNVTMATSLSADTVNANDAITYKVTFRGTGNLKLLKAPTINFPLDFEVYDPKESRDLNITENGMAGSVSFEYPIIPRYSGDYKIPAIRFSYFDSQSNTYKTIAGAEYNIHVRKGADKGQVETSTGNQVKSFKKEDVRMLGQDIRYIKTHKNDLRPKGVLYFATMEYWLSFLIPFVLFVVGMILNSRRIKANADLVRVKSKTANKMAQKRLRAASVAMKAGNSELFYQETLNALWGYVSYKLNIAASELNRDNISDHLTRRGADATLIQSFIEVLDHCEYARYAPGANQGEEMDNVYKDSISIITKLDKAI